MSKTARKTKAKPIGTPDAGDQPVASFVEDQPMAGDNVIHLSARAAGSRIADRRILPWSSLTSSPLNPRKHFEKEDLDTLAASIAEHGVLENLIVRPTAGVDPELYEIVIGDRRFRAVGQLIERGITQDDFPMPVMVESLDDKEVLTIAMAENMARADLTPMEEARGIAALMKQGMTTQELANRLGKTQRYIQQRKALVDKLAPEVQTALDEGKVTISQARALTMAKPKEQAGLLKDIDRATSDGVTEQQIKRWITNDLPPVKVALFKLPLYTGEMATDPDTGEDYFADLKQFEKLQAEAVKKKVEELKATHAEVRVIDRRKSHELFHPSDYEKAKNGDDALAVIVIPYRIDQGVAIHARLKKPAALKTTGKSKGDKPAPAAPEDAVMAAHRVHAHVRKTQVLQRAVMKDPLAAQRILCAMMILEGADAPFSAINVSVETNTYTGRRGFKDIAESDAIAREPGEAIEKILGKTPHDKFEKVWPIVSKLNAAKLGQLLAALVAEQAGTWCDHNGASGLPIADSDEAIAIAALLGIAGKEEKHGLTLELGDLEGLKKPALLGIAALLKIRNSKESFKSWGVDDAMSAKEIRDKIADKIEGNETKIVLPTLRFATEKDTLAAIKALVKEGK